MKKIICIMLVLTLAVSAVGCMNAPDDDNVKEPTVNTGSVDTDEGEKVDTNSTGKQPSADITISETVLLDESGVKITAKSIDTDGFMGTEVKLLIENNTEKNLTVQTRNTSINGFMVDSSMSTDVAAGKKANDTITFFSSDLEESGISDIAQIEVYFHIFDTDEWEDYIDSDKIIIETSIADAFDYSYEMEGVSIYEGNGIVVKAKGLSEDEFYGPELVLCIYNGGDKTVTIQSRDVSVNGFMIDPIFSADVMPGKYAIDSVTFFDSTLEENAIEEITEIELALHIYNFEDWETIVDTDPITLNFD